MEQTARGIACTVHVQCMFIQYNCYHNDLAAKDRLSELNSREGDWFMDELCTMSGNVSQMAKTLDFCLGVCSNMFCWVFIMLTCF